MAAQRKRRLVPRGGSMIGWRRLISSHHDPENAVAQSQPTSSRDAVRDVVPALIHYTETVLFGDVWERPGLSKRDRSLIVVATLIALGRESSWSATSNAR